VSGSSTAFWRPTRETLPIETIRTLMAERSAQPAGGQPGPQNGNELHTRISVRTQPDPSSVCNFESIDAISHQTPSHAFTEAWILLYLRSNPRLSFG
jgi:hypothetical protein